MLDQIGSVLGSIASITGASGPRDDDFVDRLNHVISVSLLSVFTIFVSTKQFAGTPINCWLSKNYEDSHKAYITSYCWIQNTYRASFSDMIPVDVADRERANVRYYQWIPVILMFQVFLFKFPNVVWKSFKEWSGINISKICSLAENAQTEDSAHRRTDIQNIASTITRWLVYRREVHHNAFARAATRFPSFTTVFFFLGPRNGTYLCGLYLFIKLLYLINSIAQFFILNAFLGEDFSTFGFDVIRMLSDDGHIDGLDWFPKVTFCDFLVRQLNNVQRHTTQCVLSINLFTEKIFVFIWFWLCLLAAVNLYSWLWWCYKIFFRRNHVEHIKKYLTAVSDPSRHREEINRFVDVFLRDDGAFVLRVVASNSTSVAMFDLMNELWAQFEESEFFPHR